MELYFGVGACSLAPHILLREAGANFKTHKVDLRTKQTDSGDFREINPKGQVPALKTDDGKVLTEVAVVLQYIADQNPDKNLLPKWGTWERYKANEWLNYVSSEIHKGMGLLFALDGILQTPESKLEFRKNYIAALGKRFDYLSNHLTQNQYLMGNQFSAPDTYLFTILNWHNFLKVDLTPWPNLMSYMERVKSRPSVQAAFQAEGLK